MRCDGGIKKLTIAEAADIIQGLQDEIRRSRDSRYDHRLHALLLVAQGLSGRAVARYLGDGPRTVANWVRQFEASGLAGLVDGDRPGRPARLREGHYEEIGHVLRGSPLAVGMTTHAWDGKTLSAYVQQQYGLRLGTRQCQRLFRQLGFRLRTPRPVMARSDPQRQATQKKTPRLYAIERGGFVGVG